MKEIVLELSYERNNSNYTVDFSDVIVLSQIGNTVNNMIQSIAAYYNLKCCKEIKVKTQAKEIAKEHISLSLAVESKYETDFQSFHSFLSGAISSLKTNNDTGEFSFLHSFIQSLHKMQIQHLRIQEQNTINEWNTEEFLNNKNLSEENLAIKIQDGLDKLISIINQIIVIIGRANIDFPYYNYCKPKYYFRGITRFYNDNGVPSNEKNIKVEERKVKDDFIKSSLAVRLKDTSKSLIKNKNNTRTFYVNALEDIIRKAKNMYPNKYPTDMSDLDILADIQHNGGATCLVDFSKNILTSIWFACNADFHNNGYVYCYNIMEDMIKNDALTYIRPEDENRKIAQLISQTYRETNVCSDVETRFCLWEPSKKNNRIIRQDSVFVFGIEKFKVSEHAIEIVSIPAEWKSSILTAMKAIFNISGNSVYSDHIGFASNLNKLRPYRKMLDSVYTRGYANMIKGHYDSALDFLKLAEIEYLKLTDQSEDKEWNNRMKLELYFSLAVCYKNLSRQDEKIHYLENANLEYKKVVDFANNILDEEIPTLKEDDKKKYVNYYRHKIIRAYNARVTLMYKLERYIDAITICRDIIDTIKKWGKTSENGKSLTSAYCEISILELRDLELIRHCKNNQETSALIQEFNNKSIEQNDKDSNDNDNPEDNVFDFFKLLTEYYNEIEKVIQNEQYSNKKVEDKIKEWNDKAEDYLEKVEGEKEKQKSKQKKQKSEKQEYILWNFTDIKNAIDSIEKEHYCHKKKTRLQDLTACVISLRDLYEMHGWWSYDKV